MEKSSFVNQRSRSETLQHCTDRIICLCSSFAERCAQGSNKHAEAADLWKIIPPLSFIQQFEDYKAEGLACCVVEKCDRPAEIMLLTAPKYQLKVPFLFKCFKISTRLCQMCLCFCLVVKWRNYRTSAQLRHWKIRDCSNVFKTENNTLKRLKMLKL